MRATPFNAYAILSLFSVAIHAAPRHSSVSSLPLPECPTPSNNSGPVGPVCTPGPSPTTIQLPECPTPAITGFGPGPICSPGPKPTSTPPSLLPCPTPSTTGFQGGPGPICSPDAEPMSTLSSPECSASSTDYGPVGALCMRSPGPDPTDTTLLPTGFLPTTFLPTDFLPTSFLPTDFLPSDFYASPTPS